MMVQKHVQYAHPCTTTVLRQGSDTRHPESRNTELTGEIQRTLRGGVQRAAARAHTAAGAAPARGPGARFRSRVGSRGCRLRRAGGPRRAARPAYLRPLEGTTRTNAGTARTAVWAGGRAAASAWQQTQRSRRDQRATLPRLSAPTRTRRQCPARRRMLEATHAQRSASAPTPSSEGK